MAEVAASRSRMHHLCERTAGGVALASMLIGLMVLAGWAWDLEPLKTVLPGLVAMNPATALAFVIAGGSLWLQHRNPESLAKPAAGISMAQGAAIVVVAIGLLRLLAYALDWQQGVDQLLFADKLHDARSGPNRMAPNTAVTLVLLGLGLLLLDLTTVRNRRPAELFALTAILISLLALFGYAYQVPQFYGLAAYIPMALHTAMVSGLLALGILFARPARGLMSLATSGSQGGLLVRRLLPATVLTLFVLGWLRLEGERRGLYGMELGVALYTLANITIFGAMVWWNARALHTSQTGREQAEAVRDHALAINRMIMDNSLDVICAVDGDGRFVEVSAASSKLWGYPPSELIGRGYADLVHPDDLARTVQVAGAVTAGQPAVGFNNRYLRKDGQAIEIDWSAVWSPPDALMFCVARDATQRRLAEELVKQNQRQTRAIIDSASDAFVAIDRFGLIIDWNASAETVFGWTRAEAMGKRLSSTIVPPQHREAHERGLDHYLATGQGPVLNRSIEITALHRDGHEIQVELTIWPVTAGESTTFNAFVRDISQRRRAEQAILSLNAELTANAVELQQTNHELESFSYSISHDLRAPLRHIDGYAGMLQEDAGDQLDGEMRRYLDAISDSARRMGVLIDDLLAFSKMGRQPVERTMVDMNALVARALHEIGSQRPPGTRVQVAVLPPAHGDPAMLRQVWINLLSNALKYSATRGDAAVVEVSGETDGGMTRYRIRDNGVGFDMRYADKLFGVFQRLHSQDEFEGTGVGLAIVQRILTRHGGRIYAEAEPDRGATFTIELPVADTLATEAV